MRKFKKALFAKIRLWFSCDIPRKHRINKSLHFHHCVGIVVSVKAVFTGEAHIWQNVTIGGVQGEYPKIGNHVYILSNACVIGNVNIGDNVIIGAGSVVTKSVPANSIAVGNPARVIRSSLTMEEIKDKVWG